MFTMLKYKIQNGWITEAGDGWMERRREGRDGEGRDGWMDTLP